MTSTKVKVIGFKKVMSLIRKEIIQELRSKDMRLGIADIVIEAIQNNKTPVTSDVTLAFREYFEQFNKTDPKYSRSQINVTFTGQLMEDLRKNVRLESKKGEFSYVFEQSNRSHKGYKFRGASVKGDDGKKRAKLFSDAGYIKSGKNKGKQRKGKSGTTEKIAFNKISEYLYAKGYNYLDINDSTLTKATDFVQNRISQRLRKFLKSQ